MAENFLLGLSEGVLEDTKHFYTNEMDISPCQGCLCCATAEDQSCIIKDDMGDIYSGFIDANVIVFASPMYWGYLTAQLKTVIDRMEALVMWDHFKGKTFIVLISYWHHCESTVAFFERICAFFEVQLHVITCRTLDPETGKDLPLSRLDHKMAEAFELGKKVGKR